MFTPVVQILLLSVPAVGQMLMNGMFAPDDFLGGPKKQPVSVPGAEEFFKPKLTITSMKQNGGFSSGTYDHDETGVAEDMYAFLVHLFDKHPEYNRKFYITGESYAGHYIPAISHKIFIENQKANTLTIKLEGVAIGNGMTDPEEQYKWYPDMAYNSTTAPSRVSKLEYWIMKATVPGCVDAIKSCNKNGGWRCSVAFLRCNLPLLTPYQLKGLNPYDMRKKCDHPPLCYDFSNVDKFLNNKSVQEQLGVNTEWQQCNKIVNLLFNQDWMHNFHTLLTDQIEGGLRVLIYAGDVDYICNWIGNKHWALELEWKGQEKFKNEEDKEYKDPSGTAVGKLRSVTLDNGGQFAFMQVYQAGHTVPMDQPAVALQMVNQFLDNELPTSHLSESGTRS
ncbi:hypothetical protein FOL47_001826 [Perkinsus chesapeaki]|uniref:Carboxypeptidase n=1 Tax=Perkinsus chesapeaki TaxID=330153 RepID=A0A7J6MGT9_PERCH|nr:hypothetical protein FOL47_001826 [Perkinsus chesapeaki]